MTPEHWQHIKEIFYAALERPPAERESFIDSVCSSDEETRREVSRLISAHLETDEFLAVPAFDVAAKPLASINRENLTQGESIRHYTVIRAVGTGGMGEVYRAKDTRLNRVIAIKVLSSRISDNVELRERFRREAQTIANVNHPHICVLHDIGQHDGMDYLVMEYLPGGDLNAILKREKLTIEKLLQIAIDLCDALARAHRLETIHRDLKPGNVMVTTDGHAKLLDFGLARIGTTQATPALETLTSGLSAGIDDAIRYLRTVPEESLLQPREVGRQKLPSTTLGLIFHAAEHSSRHAGQMVTLCRVVRESRGARSATP